MTITEQSNPNTTGIDRAPTLEALRLINREDQGVAIAVERTLPAVAEAIDQIVARLRKGGHLFYIGTGTSGRLGVLDASEIPPTFGAPPELVQAVIAGGYDACHRAVEASEDDREAGARDLASRGVGPGDAVIGLAASGRTPYTIGAVAYARSLGALTVCVTCNPGSELSQAAEIPIEAVVGPEVIAGSTRLKAGTAQKLVLNMISTMAMVRLGLVSGNRMSNLQARNVKLRARAIGILQAECGIEEARAREVLDSAAWNLPVALVMQRTGANSEQAMQALLECGSSVNDAVKRLTGAAS
jgi:N-acetylmuramic acid 6-phosphate etherase